MNRELTYGELVSDSERLAAGLRSRSIERFGITASSPVDVVALLVAADEAGAEPCVYPRDLTPPEIEQFSRRFDHSWIVGDEPTEELEAAEVTVADLRAGGESRSGDPSEGGGVLIMTTGTTGRPKGARHTWERLAGAVRRSEGAQDERWLLSYNVNQFAGIQVILHVLVNGGTLVVPRSRQPHDVLDAIAGNDVTHVSGTPTFWRMLIGAFGALEDGPPRLRQVTLGGEATPDWLIERLDQLFPDTRISHVYAGTEFGSAISVSDRRGGLPVSVLERSNDAPVRVRIVDGELQLSSRVGMLGYHGEQDPAEAWQPTGDLVEVHGDRIHFVGRTSEIINVGGAKVHPLPIEELISAIPGVALVAAYGRPNSLTGEIVAVDVVAEQGADTNELRGAIKARCAQLPAPGRPRSIRFVDEIETRGSKLTRAKPEKES